MAEYIERDCLIDMIAERNRNTCNWKMSCIQMKRMVETIPAADVSPVRHGRWIKKWDLYDKGFYIGRKIWYECSYCGMKTLYKDEFFEKEVGYNCCPNCGCKMDLEG